MMSRDKKYTVHRIPGPRIVTNASLALDRLKRHQIQKKIITRQCLKKSYSTLQVGNVHVVQPGNRKGSSSGDKRLVDNKSTPLQRPTFGPRQVEDDADTRTYSSATAPTNYSFGTYI